MSAASRRIWKQMVVIIGLAAALVAQELGTPRDESEVFNALGGTDAASTASVLRAAVEQRVPLLSLDSSNIADNLPLLEHSAAVKNEIEEAVRERGATALIPVREVSLARWSGAGYVIDEGSNLHYRITGGMNGGVWAPSVGETGVSDFMDTLVNVVQTASFVLMDVIEALLGLLAAFAVELLDCWSAATDAERAAAWLNAAMVQVMTSAVVIQLEFALSVGKYVIPPPQFAVLAGVTALAVVLSAMSAVQCADLRFSD